MSERRAEKAARKQMREPWRWVEFDVGGTGGVSCSERVGEGRVAREAGSAVGIL